MPVLANDDCLIPTIQDVSNLVSTSHNDNELMENEGSEESTIESDTDDYNGISDNVRSKFDQAEISDLVIDLRLSNEQSELLASRLKEKDCLKEGTKITYHRNRDQYFRKFFTQSQKLVYCKDIDGLIKELGTAHIPEEWRLFIDSSKRSLKAVLLHNGNTLASVRIAHSTTINKNYINMKYLLQELCYEIYKWKICTDLKVVTIILGQQTGFTKFPCFLCLWDSRSREDYYKKKVWLPRNEFVVGERNIAEPNQVDPKSIILPPLHIKLGLIKQFVKALRKRDSRAFHYLFTKFPKISDAKIKERVFDGPQVRELKSDPEFANRMSATGKKAWESFINVCDNFLGNKRDKN